AAPPPAGDLAFDFDGDSSLLTEVSLPQSALAELTFRFMRTTSSIAVTIQPTATKMVMRVKTSPALVPKALEPPTPPNAPARPPPLPRWIRITQTRNSDPSTIRTFRMPMRKSTVSPFVGGGSGPDWLMAGALPPISFVEWGAAGRRPGRSRSPAGAGS